MRQTLWILVALAGCNDGGDDSGGTEELPDVTGRYNVIPGAATGCEGQDEWLKDWVEGSLTIEGEPQSLVYDFGDDVELEGSVSGSFSTQFSGELSTGGANLVVSADGDYSVEDGRWVLRAEVTVEADDDSDETCTMIGPIEAYQLSEET